MSFTLERASRVDLRPLIGIYAESGCGKTFSALLIMRGFAGPDGRIAIIDTESKRASLFADDIPGGFDRVDFDPPFSPVRAIEAMDAVEAAGTVIGCIDSASHFWEGPGGVLDQAAEIEEKSGKPGLHCWKTPKMGHALWVQRMLRSKIPWIICCRAKYKNRQVKNERGKSEIVKDDYATPLQSEDLLFEMTLHAQILPDHSWVVKKDGTAGLRACFPASGPIKMEHGAALAAWCRREGPAAAPVPAPSTAQPTDQKGLISALWKMCEPIRGAENSWKMAWAQLAAWKIIDPSVHPKPSSLTPEELLVVLDKTSLAIGQNSDIVP